MKAARPPVLLLAGVLTAVLAGGCSDDGTSPEPTLRYVITVHLLEDMSAIKIKVTRRDHRLPGAVNCITTVDGEPATITTGSGENEAFYDAPIEPAFAEPHVVVVWAEGRTATATIETPGEICSVALRSPPPDSLFFLPGEDFDLAWDYAGDMPTEFSLLAVIPRGGSIPFIHTESLPPSEDSAVISGSLWGSATQAGCELRAYRRGGVSGPLADDGSDTTVILATQQFFLRRMPSTLSSAPASRVLEQRGGGRGAVPRGACSGWRADRS